MNLVLLKASDFLEENVINIAYQDHRYTHIKKILGLHKGDTFKAGLLNQNIGAVLITDFTDNYLKGLYQPESEVAPPYPIHLLLGAVRPIVMKRLVKDVCSMGIASLTVFASENGEKSYIESSFWQKNGVTQAIDEGLAQGFHVQAPVIKLKSNLQAAMAEHQASLHKFILDPYTLNKWPTSLTLTYQEPIAILIGSERGFTRNELFMAANGGYHPVSLTRRILRTETATIATLSLAIRAFEN